MAIGEYAHGLLYPLCALESGQSADEVVVTWFDGNVCGHHVAVCCGERIVELGGVVIAQIARDAGAGVLIGDDEVVHLLAVVIARLCAAGVIEPLVIDVVQRELQFGLGVVGLVGAHHHEAAHVEQRASISSQTPCDIACADEAQIGVAAAEGDVRRGVFDGVSYGRSHVCQSGYLHPRALIGGCIGSQNYQVSRRVVCARPLRADKREVDVGLGLVELHLNVRVLTAGERVGPCAVVDELSRAVAVCLRQDKIGGGELVALHRVRRELECVGYQVFAHDISLIFAHLLDTVVGEYLHQGVGPQAGQIFGARSVGVQVECAVHTALGGELGGMLLKVGECRRVAIVHKARIAAGIFGYHGVHDRTVALEAVQSGLQVGGPVVRVGAVPCGIVDDEARGGELGMETVDDGLHVRLEVVRADGRACGALLRAVVGAQHNGEVERAVLRGVGGGRAHGVVVGRGARQPVYRSQTADAAVAHFGLHARALLYQLPLDDRRRLCRRARQRSAIGDAIAYEHYVNLLLSTCRGYCEREDEGQDRFE